MQTAKTSKPSPALARLAGLVLFLSLAAGVEGILFAYRQGQASVADAQTATQAAKIRAQLEGELGVVTALGNGAAGYWAVRHDFPAAEARNLLAGLYPQSRHVRSFAVLVDYRVAYVFPQDDTGQPTGFDYRSLPGSWPLLQHSAESRAPLLAGPLPLAAELAYWVPVYGDDKPLGVLSLLIDKASLFAAAGLSQAGEGYQYALRSQKAPGQRGDTILGADGLFDEAGTVTTDIAVPGGQWRLAVKPAPKSSAQPTGADIFRAFGWLFAGLFAIQSVALTRLKRKLSDLAFYDTLTGLPSRHLFLDRLKQMIRRTKRNRGNFSVLFISLDAQPSRERQVGDMMLAGIGKRLIGAIRHCDTVTRWDGSEFLVLLDACPLDQAKRIAENLRHKIELPVSYGQNELRAGASIGLATYPEDGHSLTTLLKVADKRMLEDRGRRTA